MFRTRPRSKITRSATSGSSSSCTRRMPVTASTAGAGVSASTSGPPRRWGTSSRSSAVAAERPASREPVLEPHEIAAHERLEQAGAGRLGHLQAGHQRGEQRSVADADAVVLQTGLIESVAEHGERLRGTVRRGRADQLDPCLQELPLVPALRTHAPVAVGEIAEAQGRLARRVARRDHARDRHGHVRAQHQHGARLVEHAVGRLGIGHVGARQHRLVLERRACRSRRSRGARTRRAACR